MKRLRSSGWIAGLALLCAAQAHAAPGVPIDGALAEPRSALRVNDWVLSTAALEALLRVVRAHKPETTPAQVVAAAAEDRVLGGYARGRYDDAALFAGERVRFSPQTSVEVSLATTLQAAFRKPLAKAMGPAEGYIVKRHPLTRERLVALLDRGGRLRLDDRLPAARMAKLKNQPLIDGRVGAQSYRISLYDVWERQDVQGRDALYRFDVGFAIQQARQLARDRFVLAWAAQSSGLGVAGVEQLRQLVADRNRRNALARRLGSGEDPHYSSPEIARLQRQVEPAAIREYYERHKAEFARTDKVLMRSLRFADEAQARAVAAQLSQGARFEDIARRRGGDGLARWVDREAARHSWVAQLAFAQPPGAASPPIREPETQTGTGAVAPGWIIVQVEQRIAGLHPPGSETVRFAAGEAIARQRAASSYAALKARLLSEARIEVNPAALAVPTAPKMLMSGL